MRENRDACKLQCLEAAATVDDASLGYSGSAVAIGNWEFRPTAKLAQDWEVSWTNAMWLPNSYLHLAKMNLTSARAPDGSISIIFSTLPLSVASAGGVAKNGRTNGRRWCPYPSTSVNGRTSPHCGMRWWECSHTYMRQRYSMAGQLPTRSTTSWVVGTGDRVPSDNSMLLCLVFRKRKKTFLESVFREGDE